jgi:hypothetical protein
MFRKISVQPQDIDANWKQFLQELPTIRKEHALGIRYAGIEQGHLQCLPTSLEGIFFCDEVKERVKKDIMIASKEYETFQGLRDRLALLGKDLPKDNRLEALYRISEQGRAICYALVQRIHMLGRDTYVQTRNYVPLASFTYPLNRRFADALRGTR